MLLRARTDPFSIHREPPHYDRDGQSDTEDVYDYANGHHLERKRKFYGSRERHHNAIHEEVDSDAIQDTRSRRVLKKEGNPTGRRKVDSCGAKCDEKVAEKPKQSGCDPALEGPRTQQARGDPLQ
jgi:hypothetical protein